jgi:hypothetical protein
LLVREEGQEKCKQRRTVKSLSFSSADTKDRFKNQAAAREGQEILNTGAL